MDVDDDLPSLLAYAHGRPHPARRMDFADLTAGLDRAVAAGNVVASREGGLELYTYTTRCQFGREWDLFSLISRGLVLDRPAGRVVATPFPKFFNLFELGLAAPDEPFEVTEKVDGSLGILFHDGTGWRVCTRRSLASDQARWATEFIARGGVDAAKLSPGTTYLVEIVYPENRVVVRYDFEALVLLGAYDERGHELDRPALERAGRDGGMRVVGARSYGSVGDLLAAAGGLGRQEEGFVLRFAGGLRVKVKGEEYCRVHRLITRCTPLAVWESMMAGGEAGLDSLRKDLPEEMTADFDAIRRLLRERLEALLAGVRAAHESVAVLSDRELGALLQGGSCAIPRDAQKFLFACRHRGFLDAVHEPGGEWRQRAFRLFRPDGNRLAGYVPSTAMTRFAAEAE